MATQVDNAPPQEPVRLLAVAYDSNWRLKKVVPEQAIPVGWSLPDHSKALPIGKSPTRSPRPPKSDRSSKPTSLSGSKGEPISPGKSPEKTAGRRETDRGRKARDKSGGLKFPSRKALFSDSLDIPNSLGSTVEEQKKTSARKQQESDDGKDQESDDEREEKPLAEWAEESGVPLDLAYQALYIFVDFISNSPPPERYIRTEEVMVGKPFDAGADLGSMDDAAFGKACCRIADVGDLTGLPAGFLANAMQAADKDGSGDIDFGEFLYFYYKFSFSEEVLVGADERLLRAAAREHRIPYDEIGRYKYKFDQTDTDKNGTISIDEFKILINKLLKVPRGEEIPVKRFKDMWKEACRGTDGADLDFIRFVGWYKRYFMGDNVQGENPFEAFYKNIRRVSVYDSSLYH